MASGPPACISGHCINTTWADRSAAQVLCTPHRCKQARRTDPATDSSRTGHRHSLDSQGFGEEGIGSIHRCVVEYFGRILPQTNKPVFIPAADRIRPKKQGRWLWLSWAASPPSLLVCPKPITSARMAQNGNVHDRAGPCRPRMRPERTPEPFQVNDSYIRPTGEIWVRLSHVACMGMIGVRGNERSGHMRERGW